MTREALFTLLTFHPLTNIEAVEAAGIPETETLESRDSEMQNTEAVCVASPQVMMPVWICCSGSEMWKNVMGNVQRGSADYTSAGCVMM